MDLRNRRKQLLLQERLQQSSWCPTHFGISSSTVSGTRCFSKRSRTLFVVESMELLIITTVHPKLPQTTKHKTSEKWSECIWNFSLMTLTFISDEKYLWNWKVRRWILVRGVTRGERGAQFPGAESLWGVDSLRWASKNHNNVASTYFNTVYMHPKDIRFEHGGAKLAFCPGRHLTSLRPWNQHLSFEVFSEMKPLFYMQNILSHMHYAWW